ncbi:metabotropic glutamate receptor-like [Tropilaelaps mercedesae]|uniref:Metabotropic glutamate receptor-like n=1 Tax=Tropilaelaps mercedesae TaxID=418985 RepID=A0A1V9X8E8_9ACAR|nr:metabotropic glutamate receptor-like [Tropilaelaps mercedesae]
MLLPDGLKDASRPLAASLPNDAGEWNGQAGAEDDDLVNSTVRFDEKGDAQAPYIIYNYRRNYSTGELQYIQVGKWLGVEEGLELMAGDITFGSRETHDRVIPVSVCSAECGIGEVKKVQAGDHCCWICTRCEPHEFVVNESTCADCGPSRWPHPHKRSCFDLPVQHMQWDSLFAAVPIAVAILGIVLTCGTIAVFLRNNETPIVKASGRELSYMLLSGILICYLMTFGVGLGFSIIYGSLLTKTNRISRIFDSARRSARRPSFISPKSQMVITCMLISVQVMATLIWFVLEPPATRTEYPEGRRNQVILKCKIRDSSFLVSLVYNMFLITTCTVYAIKTRKIPENFNESKFIGFTMYTTCIIWLAFVPIYFGTGNNFQVQITTLCVSISLSAYVALFCLFSPKVYIVLFHPDKNVRKLTMNSATYKKAPTSSTTGVGGGGGPPGHNQSGGPGATVNNQPPTTCTTGRLHGYDVCRTME